MANLRSNTGSDEWYTPLPIVEMARQVMGGIDLDPASTPEANAVVDARHIFTADDDGLAQPWHGRVWLNPPYGRGDITGKWWAKLYQEWLDGRCREAMFLANNNTETRWFQHAVARFPVLLVRGRLSFWRVGGKTRNGFLGTCIVYIPPNEAPLRTPLYIPQDVPLDAPLPPSLFPDAAPPAPSAVLSPDAMRRFADIAGPLGQIVISV